MDVAVHPLRSVVSIACRPKKDEDGDLSKARKSTKKSDGRKKKASKQLGSTEGRIEFWD